MSSWLVFDTLVEASSRAVLVAGFFAIVLALFRAKTPALRHAVWTAALAIMLTLPLTSAWLPTIQVPMWLPAPALARFASVPPEIPAAPQPIPASPSISSAAPAAVNATLTTTPTGPAPLRRSVTLPAASPAQDWRPSAVLLWMLVAGAMLLREAIGWRLAHRLVREGVPAAIGDGTYESERVTTPVVTGVLRPRVLVPSSWPQWGNGVRRMVLAHERAHVTRRDPLVAALARVNRSIFWFHPLAWWMERHLSRLAERACDEAVVRELKDSRLYAALLVEMAHRLQRHGQRVAWQGIGIVSSRPFEDRLDRILQGPAPDLPRRSKAAMAAMCAALFTIAVACGSPSSDVTTAPPLAEDPELAKDIAIRETRTAEYEAAIAMTLDQVAALEKAVAANPDDLDATRKLLIFYRESGQKLMGWNAMVAARRPHLLRLIARHPDSTETYWPFARRLDPEGYEQARVLWMTHVARPDVSARVLGQAAEFFEISEKAEAERLFLRALAMDPDGPQPRVAGGVYYPSWASRIGVLYAKAIVGSDDETVFNVVKSVNPAEAAGPFAQHARSELARATNPVIVASAGSYLTNNASRVKLDFDHRALGMSYLERAASLDPKPSAVRTLEWAKRSRAHGTDYRRVVEQLGKSPHQLDAKEFDQLSDEMKVQHGHDLLWAPYGDAMGAYQKPDPAAVKKALSEFHRRAEVLDRTAKKAGVAPDAAARLTTDVHLALATYAMRMGDRAEAVRRLGLAASSAPSTTDDIAARDEGLANYRAIELTHELLKAGERESVAQYYDAVAKTAGEEQRKIYEPAAAAIRAGKMPKNYQYYLARTR